MRRLRSQHSPRNFGHLFGSLASAENYFGITLPQCAMMVDLRKTHIFVRKPAQPLHRGLQANLAASNFSQKFPDVALIHRIFACLRSIIVSSQPLHSSISPILAPARVIVCPDVHSFRAWLPLMLELRPVRRPHPTVGRRLVSHPQKIWRHTMWLLWEILIGILVGFLAGQIVKGHGMGVLVDLIVGIIGSLLGGWIFGLLGLAAYGLIGQLVMGVVGAVILLLLVRLIKRA